MAGSGVKVSGAQVAAIASSMEKLNNKLTDELNTSSKLIRGLSSIWSGEAAETTISTFNAFASKYFDNYQALIKQYIQFLRNNVEEGYTQTEKENVRLADQLK